MTVDTLEIVRKLEAAGTPRGQAEALAAVFRDSETTSLANLATKTDLAAVKTELVAEIASVRTDLKAEIAAVRSDMALAEHRVEARFVQIDGRFAQLDGKFVQLEQRMTIKLGGMMVVAVGAVAALVRLL